VAHDDDSPVDEIVAAFVEAIPVAGPLLAPAARRASLAVRKEYRRNVSTALKAAEHISGMTREELADVIAQDPELVPLLTRLLYVAGMSGSDQVLSLLGAALGDAALHRDRIDEAELILATVADLSVHHLSLLRTMVTSTPDSPESDPPPRFWLATISRQSGLSQELTGLCLARLVGSGLVNSVSVWNGVMYAVTELGRTVLDMIDHLSVPSSAQVRVRE
jgi:hypothetical protein